MQKTLNNRTIFCKDNLEVLRGIDTETIDLIYLDPPFNKKKEFIAPTSTSAKGASFKDIFTKEDIKDEWTQTIKEDHFSIHELLNSVKIIEGRTSYNFCYLAYMAIRLIECHRILKNTGSIYLHCDPTMSHYLKILLDCIFSEKNFRNEIIWKRKQDTHNLATKKMGGAHDIILWVIKSNQAKYNKTYLPYSEEYVQDFYKYNDKKGQYRLLPCTNESGGNTPYDFRGITRAWRFSPKNMQNLYKKDMLAQLTNKGPWYYKKYLEKAKGTPIQDLWNDIPAVRGNQSVGYPTQKPRELLERIIAASSNEGEVVLDPFCGCATTCVAAEKLNRQWIGVDISIEAYNLVKKRLKEEVANPKNLFDWNKAIHFLTDPPARTDDGATTANQKYVYVISHPKYKGEYKVGVTSNVKQRLNGYQTSDPDRSYKLEHYLLTTCYRELERYIHETFDNKHEWVSGELPNIIKAIDSYAPPK